MNNVIKELLLMRKCMTNDYYISVKNKTNCFLNSCKKKTQSYKTNVFHLFHLSSTFIPLCHNYAQISTIYVYIVYCIWVFPIRIECQEMNGRSVCTYIYKERKKPVRFHVLVYGEYWALRQAPSRRRAKPRVSFVQSAHSILAWLVNN